jgi:hypothetical protein
MGLKMSVTSALSAHPGITPAHPGSPRLTSAAPDRGERRRPTLTRQNGKGNVEPRCPEFCPPPPQTRANARSNAHTESPIPSPPLPPKKQHPLPANLYILKPRLAQRLSPVPPRIPHQLSQEQMLAPISGLDSHSMRNVIFVCQRPRWREEGQPTKLQGLVSRFFAAGFRPGVLEHQEGRHGPAL